MSKNGKNSMLQYMRKIPVSKPTHVEETIEASSTNDEAIVEAENARDSSATNKPVSKPRKYIRNGEEVKDRVTRLNPTNDISQTVLSFSIPSVAPDVPPDD